MFIVGLMIKENLREIAVPENSELENSLESWYPNNAFSKEDVGDASEIDEEGVDFRHLDLDKQIRDFVKGEWEKMQEVEPCIKPQRIVIHKENERPFYSLSSYYSEAEKEKIINQIKEEYFDDSLR